MAAPVGRKTKAQGDQELIHTQSGFMGGLCTNSPPGSITSTQLPMLENFIPSRAGMRTRPGTRLLKNMEQQDMVFQLECGQVIGIKAATIVSCDFVGASIPDPTTAPAALTPATGKGLPTAGTVTDIQEADGMIWIVKGGKLYTIEQDTDGRIPTGYTALFRNPGNVNEKPCPLFNQPLGVFRYRAMYTGAIYEGTTLLLEGPSTPVTTQGGFAEATYSDRQYGTLLDLGLSANMPVYEYDPGKPWDYEFSRLGYTHIRIYRTKELNGEITYDANGKVQSEIVGADPDVYYLAGAYEIATQTITWEARPPGLSGMPADNELVVPIGTRYHEHLPRTLTRIMVTPGILFALTPATLYYSDTASRPEIGNYFPGLQQIDNNRITAMFMCNDRLVLTTTRATFGIVPSLSIEAGNSSYGESIPVLGSGMAIIDPYLGISDPKCVFASSGKVYARCSDGTIRHFDGSTWSDDYAKETISEHLRTLKNTEQRILARPDGVIYLWTNESDYIYRFASSEEKGFGWTSVTGTAFPVAASTFTGGTTHILRDEYGSPIMAAYHLVLGVGYVFTEIEYEPFDVDTTVQENETGIEEVTVDIIPKLRTRDIMGTSERFYVEHEHTQVFLHPIPGRSLPAGLVAGFSMYCDGETGSSQDIPLNVGDSFAVFSGTRVCNRFGIKITFSKAGFYLPEFSVQFRSLDQRPLTESTTQMSTDKILQGVTIGRMDSGHSLLPSSEWTVPYTPQYRTNGLRNTGYDAVLIPDRLAWAPADPFTQFSVLAAIAGIADTSYGVFTANGALDGLAVTIVGTNIQLKTASTVHASFNMGSYRAPVVFLLTRTPTTITLTVYLISSGATIGTVSVDISLTPTLHFEFCYSTVYDFRMYSTLPITPVALAEYARDISSGQFNYHRSPRRSP